MKKSIVLVRFLIIGFIFYKVSFLYKKVIALRQKHENIRPLQGNFNVISYF